MKLGVIGGSGIYSLGSVVSEKEISTNYGAVQISVVQINGAEIAFVARHGKDHNLPPHKVNYQANIAALKQIGVESIIATNAVGGITEDAGPGTLILPDQLIDYTWGRKHTFYDVFSSGVSHIDFTEPFDHGLREMLKKSLERCVDDYSACGVYGCTQGPRLETAAEVERCKRDGCTIIGMTGMPEAALAREADLGYASLCFSVNWAAGVQGAVSIEDVFRQVEYCSGNIKLVLEDAVRNFH